MPHCGSRLTAVLFYSSLQPLSSGPDQSQLAQPEPLINKRHRVKNWQQIHMVTLCALKNLYTALSYAHFVSLCLCAVVPDDIIIVSGSKVALSRGGQVSEPARLRVISRHKFRILPGPEQPAPQAILS